MIGGKETWARFWSSSYDNHGCDKKEGQSLRRREALRNTLIDQQPWAWLIFPHALHNSSNLNRKASTSHRGSVGPSSEGTRPPETLITDMLVPCQPALCYRCVCCNFFSHSQIFYLVSARVCSGPSLSSCICTRLQWPATAGEHPKL